MAMATNSHPIWHCIGKSVTGASHLRHGLPNQDALKIWRSLRGAARSHNSNLTLPLVLAVSDGHGSAKSFRSHIGSQKAVEAAIQVVTENIFQGRFNLEGQENSHLESDLATIKDFAGNYLPERIVRRWQQSVRQHLEENEITDEEWEDLKKKGGSNGQKLIGKILEEFYQAESATINSQFSIIYGATLLIAIVTDCLIVYLQIGDGDILSVDSTGNTRRPLPRDKRLIANETTSLCMEQAWNQFQVELEYLEPLEPLSTDSHHSMPALILLATDGYSNSFSSEEDFQQVGQDYREMIHRHGMDYIENQLESFLSQTSQQGSGDDITMGLVKLLEEGDLDYPEMKKKMNQHEDDYPRLDETSTAMETKAKSMADLRKTVKIAKRNSLIALGLGLVSIFLSIINIAMVFYDLGRKDESIEIIKAIEQGVERIEKIENLEERIKIIEDKIEKPRETEKPEDKN